MTNTTILSAPHPGTCVGCRAAITVGEQITVTVGQGARHARCAAAAVAPVEYRATDTGWAQAERAMVRRMEHE